MKAHMCMIFASLDDASLQMQAFGMENDIPLVVSCARIQSNMLTATATAEEKKEWLAKSMRKPLVRFPLKQQNLRSLSEKTTNKFQKRGDRNVVPKQHTEFQRRIAEKNNNTEKNMNNIYKRKIQIVRRLCGPIRKLNGVFE